MYRPSPVAYGSPSLRWRGSHVAIKHSAQEFGIQWRNCNLFPNLWPAGTSTCGGVSKHLLLSSFKMVKIVRPGSVLDENVVAIHFGMLSRGSQRSNWWVAYQVRGCFILIGVELLEGCSSCTSPSKKGVFQHFLDVQWDDENTLGCEEEPFAESHWSWRLRLPVNSKP